jgi:hypothetical protein
MLYAKEQELYAEPEGDVEKLESVTILFFQVCP